MPATTLTLTDAPGRYSQTGQAMTMAAADTVNGNRFVVPRECLIIVHNTGATSRTITITSVADVATGRTGDVSAQSVAAGEIRVFRIAPTGWADSSDANAVTLTGNHAELEIGVVDLTKNIAE